MKRILVINGPNLNMLGKREPEIYGYATLSDLYNLIKGYARSKGIKVTFIQSNYEGKIVEWIHKAEKKFDGIVINPAAFTHYSYAVLDALKSITKPAVEVHISDIKKREIFRQTSVTKAGCIDQISGKGFDGYLIAIDRLVQETDIANKDMEYTSRPKA